MSLGGPLIVDEGSEHEYFTSLLSYNHNGATGAHWVDGSFDWNFGDGYSSFYDITNGSSIFPEEHIYLDDGIFTMSLSGSGTVKDGANNLVWSTNNLSSSRRIQVLNVAPTITDVTSDLTIGIGETFDFGASFMDPGVLDTHTIAWDLNGDSLFDDYFGLSGSYSFGDIGLYTIALKVTDDDGASATSTFNADVIQRIPEPSSLALLGIGGAFALVGFRRYARLQRRRNSIP